MKLLKTKKFEPIIWKLEYEPMIVFFNLFKFNIKHHMKSSFQYSISIITDLRQTFFPS